jgi:FtsP/CotA-like multicopper oxidase with cupredoxin domain
MMDRFRPLQIQRNFMPLAATRRAFLAGVSALIAPLPALGEPTPRILEARAGKARLLPEPAAATDILGFDDANGPPGFLRTPHGPLLRFKQGDTLFARLVNKTDLPLSLHWQGVRLSPCAERRRTLLLSAQRLSAHGRTDGART